MGNLSEEQIIKEIDNQFDRWWELSHKDKLTEEEVRELKGRATKIELFKLGTKLSGMSVQKYLSLTNRFWGEKAQKTGISLCKDGCGEMTKSTEEGKCKKCGAMK